MAVYWEYFNLDYTSKKIANCLPFSNLDLYLFLEKPQKMIFLITFGASKAQKQQK
jgi:hypothetical protein